MHFLGRAAFRRTLYFVLSLVDGKSIGTEINSALQKNVALFALLITFRR